MKKNLLSLLCLLAFTLPGWADKWSYDVTDDYTSPSWLAMIKSANGEGTVKATTSTLTDASLESIAWKYAQTGDATTIQKNGTAPKGITLGSAKSPFTTVTFSTDAFNDKTISKVTVTIASVSKKCHYDMSLNCGTFSETKEKVLYLNNEGSANTAGVAEFTPNCPANNLSFTITNKGTTSNTKGGFKFCAVTIEFEDGTTTEKTPVEIFWNKDENWGNEMTLTMKKGESQRIIVGSDDPNQTSFIDKITVISDNPEIVTVNSTMDGISAVGVGSAIVTARIPEDDTQYSSNVLTVNITVEEITVTSPEAKVNGVVVADKIYVNDAVELSCDTEGATIYYSVDSDITEFNVESKEYDGTPIKFPKPCTCEMIVYASMNGVDSDKVTYLFDVVKRPAEISFTSDMATAYIDAQEEMQLPSLSNPNNLPVTYMSLDETVATVDTQTGTVTLIAPGITEIYAMFEGNDEFEMVQDNVYYTLTVEANKPAEKVKSTYTFDFTKSDYISTKEDAYTYPEEMVSIISDGAGIFEGMLIEGNGDDETKFEYVENQGWKYCINVNAGSTFFIDIHNNYDLYDNSGIEYNITSIKFNFADNKIVDLIDQIADYAHVPNNEWTGNSASATLSLETKEELVLNSIDITFEHEPVKKPSLNKTQGQDNWFLTHEDANHTIFFKITNAQGEDVTADRMVSGTTPDVPARSIKIDADHEGYTAYAEGSEFKVYDGDILSTYAQHPHGMVSEIDSRSYEDIMTGVESIYTDAEGEVIYFNMQGVQVAEPAEGIYIRVANGKATKIAK